MSTTPITVVGDVDPRAVRQLETCAEAGGAVRGALCADGHVGYSQPIGGVVAYPDHISPSGVGYDIGCVAEGEPVLTADGFHVPIERLGPDARPVRPGADGVMAPISPYRFTCAKGIRPVVRVTLADGRSARLTPDHELRTGRGWVRADALSPSDTVLCPAFTGLAYEPSPVSGALLRLAGYVNGDGHIASSGARSASIYTTVAGDVAAMAADVAAEAGGYVPPAYMRVRPNGSLEIHVRINNRALVQRLVELGCPTGRKRDASWSDLTRTLLTLPAWARAQYFAGFSGAEGATPAYAGRPVNFAIKQAGERAMVHVRALVESLGFRWAASVVDGLHAGQIVGGADEQLRFLREVGFAYTSGKSRAAARATSLALGTAIVRGARSDARARLRELCAGGRTVREAAALVSAETGLSESACVHLLYRRGTLRPPRGWHAEPAALGDCSWVPVRSVTPDGVAATYDVVTDDPEQAFVASGMTVHNCGNKAVRTDLLRADVAGDLPRIMDEVFSRISFGVGRTNDEPVEHQVLDRIRTADFAPQRKLCDLAVRQLGTVGAGNHYVDLFADEEDRVWVGVHFGSRGFGHRTASGFLAIADGLPFEARAAQGPMDSPPKLLRVDSEAGQAYISAMRLAGDYAYAGRDVVVAKVLEILGASPTYEVHNHHNFAWRERHHGVDVWVVRKGCTPAFPGQEGFVGATMGEPSVILRGVESDAGPELLYSTVHGAGRVMSRTKAAGKWRRKGGQRVQVRPGAIDYGSVRATLTALGIELRGGAADEAPAAYKRLDNVLAAHADTIEVLHRLTPIGVAMAGADVVDPYKD